MEFTTTTTTNDTLVISFATFIELYGESPLTHEDCQLYFDGFALQIEEICSFGEQVYLKSTYGLDLQSQYY